MNDIGIHPISAPWKHKTGTACILFLVLALVVWMGIQPVHANISAPMVDNSTLVVSSTVDDFTFANGMAYWTFCVGDLSNFTTYLKVQQLNDPATQDSLLELNHTSCLVYTELQASPVSLFYKNESNSRIERRDFQNIGTYTNLYSYTTTNEPTGLALADGYVYWSAKNQAIRRISVLGGTAELVANTDGIPADISIDEENIWFGTPTGVYWIKRNCAVPCTGTRVNTASVKKLFGAGKVNPTYKQAVFWIADNGTSPDTVESWDCRVPNQTACMHKTLYEGTTNFSVDGVSASDKSVFWIEVDTSTWTTRRLWRAPRDCSTICPLTDIDLLVSPVSPSGEWLPMPMILDDVDIFFKHLGISKIAQDADPLVWNFTYEAMEVTQGIQSLANDVELVKGKPTYVRLYGNLIQGEDVVAPEAQLSGTYIGVPLPGSPLQPVKRPALLSTTSVYDRNDPTTSWLFELPADWIKQSPIVLKATIDPRKLYDVSSAVSPSTSISFTTRPPICLVALRVSQHGPTARHTDPGYQLAVNTARVLLPARSIWTYYQGTTLEEGIWPFYSPYELPDDAEKLIMNIWWRDRLSDDPDECDDAGARTIYTGLIHKHTNTGSTNGMAHTSYDQNWTRLPATGTEWGAAAIGWPLNGRESSLAHEIGHNFGRPHVNCPAGSPADPGYYPYDACVLSPSTGPSVYFGFDPILTKVISPTAGSDLMSYNKPRWISDYTWERIFEANFGSPTPPAQPSLPEANGLMINGTVNINEPSGELGYAWVMPTTALSPGLQEKWAQEMAAAQPLAPNVVRYHVLFLGLSNNVLADQDIQLLISSEDPAASGKRYFHHISTAPSGLVMKLQLMADNTVLDTLMPGPFAPQVAITNPAGGETVNQTLTVSWTASEQSGDDLKFIVQFTQDSGLHWHTLASEIASDPDETNYQITFDSSRLPGSLGLDAQVRVIASDGYYTAIATSEKFQTTHKAPEAMISSPPEGIWYEAGQQITLEGSGNDPEDGHLSGAALSWKLNNASVGSGDIVYVPGLAPGAYTAELTVTDSDLSQGTGEAHFTIAPWKIAAGKAKLDGRCTDPAYANTPQIQLKPYSNNRNASVYAVRDNRYIWFCFSGLEKGTNFANSFVGVRMDTNYSRDAWAQPSDFAFFVRPDGRQFTKQGNGAGGYNDPTPSFVEYSLATKAGLDVGGNTWSAEIRIEHYYTSMGDQIGIDLAHYWVNAQGDDYHWPYSAQYNKPNTWANNFTVTTPAITSLNPEIVTLPLSSQILFVNGKNFRNVDDILWDGVPQVTFYTNSTQVWTLLQAGSLTPGEHQVEILKGGSGAVKSNPAIATVYNPNPVLTSLTPTAVAAGSGSIYIHIYGSNFVSGAVVYWNNKPYNSTFFDSGHLRIYVNASELVKPGIRKIVVLNPDPTEQVSNKITFLISEYRIFMPLVKK